MPEIPNSVYTDLQFIEKFTEAGNVFIEINID